MRDALEAAQALAHRVAIINDGAIVAEGTPAELTAHVGTRTVIRFGLPAGTTAGDLPAAVRDRVEGVGDRFELDTDTPVPDLAALCGWAVARDVDLDALSATRPDSSSFQR